MNIGGDFRSEMSALAITCGKPQPDTEANREKSRESMHAAQQPGGLEKFFDRMADTLVGPRRSGFILKFVRPLAP